MPFLLSDSVGALREVLTVITPVASEDIIDVVFQVFGTARIPIMHNMKK